jgi:hypothetical protein
MTKVETERIDNENRLFPVNIGGPVSEKKNRLDGYDTVCEKTINETILLLYLLLKYQHFYDFFLALKSLIF